MDIGRDHRIDFFRGLALIFIFWDHVPQNPLAHLTLRNIGFSDAAELFVFLAGFASALAYGRAYRLHGWGLAALRIWRRTWVLYVVHIFLLALLMGMVILANQHVETRDMVAQMNLGYFLDNPQQALVDELLLRFKPNLMDPLPLYIALLLTLPVYLPLLVRHPLVAVGVSLMLYLPATWLGWNLPAQQGGVWYFNPLAWQALFVIGAAAAVQAQRPAVCTMLRQPLLVLAATYVLLSAAVALSWKLPAMSLDFLPAWLGEGLYRNSKTNLSPLRLLHFLALAYCVARLLRQGPWLDTWAARKLRQMGRYSLELFCLGVLLAPMADALNALGDDQLAMRFVSGVLGVALMAGLAAWLELNRRLGRGPQAVGQTAA